MTASEGKKVAWQRKPRPPKAAASPSTSEPPDAMGVASSSTEPSLPGAFDDSTLLEYVESPEEYLQKLQNEWLRKHHDALRQTQAKPVGNKDDAVDWRQYSPPPGLSDASKVFSEPLTEIIPQSITNVTTRVEQELQREKEDEEARKAVEEAEAREAAKNKEPYLPIKMEDPSNKGKATETEPEEIKPDCDTESLLSRRSFVHQQVEKRRKFAFKKLFHRSEEKGESAAAGAAREAMRRELETRLSKANVESTAPGMQETLAKLRRTTTVRVPEKQELVYVTRCQPCPGIY